MSLGTYAACGTCPFILLCLMGRLFDYSYPKRYVCPQCNCIWQTGKTEVYYTCPAYALGSALRDEWRREAEHMRGITGYKYNPCIYKIDPYHPTGPIIKVYCCYECMYNRVHGKHPQLFRPR